MGKYLEKINSYNKKELYDILEPVYMNIVKKYNFINIGDDELKLIVFKTIDDCFIDLDDSKAHNFDILFLDKFTDSINEYFSSIFKDSKRFVSVVSDFVSKNINFSKNYRENLKNFKKISNFFEKIKFVPDINLCVDLLNNNAIVSNILKEIVDKNLKKIKKDSIDSLFKSLVSISFIEGYCMINDIEIYDSFTDDKSFADDNDDYIKDSTRSYLKEISKFPLLSKEKERELFSLILQGDKKAKDTFMKANLRLVVSIARKYNYGKLPFLDLIQEGNIGLMKAIDKFDVSKGYKFSTYATNWIRQGITRSIYNDSRNIRIPVHMYERISEYRKAYSLLEEKYNREPTIEEIALELNISVEKALELDNIQKDTVSVYKLIGGDGDSEDELLDFIPSSCETPEDSAINSNLSIELREAMYNSSLTDKEIGVISLRFGLGDNNPMTLEEVGKVYKVTRERIRQIEANALRKLRRNRTIKNMKIYIDDSTPVSVNVNRNVMSEEESKVARKLESIYEKLKKDGYSRELVDEVIAELSASDLELLYARHGGDLDNPRRNSDWSNSQNTMYYSKLLPKIKNNLLEKTSGKKVVSGGAVKSPGNKIVANDIVKESTKDGSSATVNGSAKKKVGSSGVVKSPDNKIGANYIVKESTKDGSSATVNGSAKKKFGFSDVVKSPGNKIGANDIVKKSTKDGSSATVNGSAGADVISSDIVKSPAKIEIGTSNDNYDFDRETYIKILKKMREHSFGDLLKFLTPKEAVVVCLKLGYVDGKYFTTEYISGFLNISQDEVFDTTKKILLVYKEGINSFIDEAIDFVSDKRIKVDVCTDNVKVDLNNRGDLVTDNCDFYQDTYVNVLEKTKKASFDDILNVLTPKEAVIVCLKLGYVDGKYFTTESISTSLGVFEKEVLDITKKALSSYKESINSFVDKAMNFVSDEVVTFNKKK